MRHRPPAGVPTDACCAPQGRVYGPQGRPLSVRTFLPACRTPRGSCLSYPPPGSTGCPLVRKGWDIVTVFISLLTMMI